jgi:hypothetical protein
MIDEERAPLNNLVEVFFPLLESVMADVISNNPPNKTLIEHLISKIFYAANEVREFSLISDVVGSESIFLGQPSQNQFLDVIL